jgi:hypothetical protein
MSFTAKYRGVCRKGCDGVKAGDEIETHGSGFAHVGECPEVEEEVDARAVAAGVCPTCFEQRSLTGMCGC